MQVYGPYVKHWALRLGISAQDGDDICQEVYRVVVARIDSFQLGERAGSFRKWIQQITRNVCREHNHRNGRVAGRGGTEALLNLQGIPFNDDFEEDPPEIVVDLYRRAVELARSEFSQRDWSIVETLVQDSLTPQEIGASFGISHAAVRQIKSRLFRRIRQELGEVSVHSRSSK
jgi:RNA polymerase sigma factor (sigma-70 family)